MHPLLVDALAIGQSLTVERFFFETRFEGLLRRTFHGEGSGRLCIQNFGTEDNLSSTRYIVILLNALDPSPSIGGPFALFYRWDSATLTATAVPAAQLDSDMGVE